MADLLANISKKATGKVSELVSSIGTTFSGKNYLIVYSIV